MNKPHIENVIFSLGQLNQQYYDLLERRKTYLNQTGKEDVITLDKLITVLKIMVEYADEINWHDAYKYRDDLKQFEDIFNNTKPNPYIDKYEDLEIGDLNILESGE